MKPEGKQTIKTCCVTGHRDIPEDLTVFVRKQLEKEVDHAIADGFTYFVSGFAEGVDLMFAQVVVNRIMEGEGIFLEAAIPYAGRLDTPNPVFQELLSCCCQVHITCQKYKKSCFLDRNMYMLHKSQRVIAVYDGRRRGGTYFTLNRAYAQGLDVHIIRI